MNAKHVCVALVGVVATHGAVMAGYGVTSIAATALLPAGVAAQGGVMAQWVKRTPSGKDAPSPKNVEDGAMVYDPARDRIVLFGGKNDADRRVDDLWAFDLDKSMWQQITMQGSKPPSIPNLSAIYDPIGHRMIAYGDRYLWSLDLKTDRWRDMSSKEQPRRESHSAVYDSRGKRMVVFGGSDGGHLDLYDIWALDLDPTSPTFEKWQNLTVEKGHPDGRIQHTAIYDARKNRMLISGGYAKDSRRMFEDTWAYQFADARNQPGTWKRIDNGRLSPPARRQAIGVYDAAQNWFILEGGESAQSTSREHLYMNDVWAFDLTADTWLPLSSSDPAPAPKISQQAAYDPDTQSVILYGGIPEDEHAVPHDVWELRIQPGE